MGNIREKTINEIKNILKKYFQKHTEIEVAYIFGSVTQGRTSSLSDIDIAVIGEQRTGRSIHRIHGMTAGAVGREQG